MRLATTKELNQMEEEAKTKWKKADLCQSIMGDGSAIYDPQFDKPPMVRCLKCEKQQLVDKCPNCSNATFQIGGDANLVPQRFALAKQTGQNSFRDTSDLGLYCTQCKHSILSWKCDCGTKNPVTKTLWVLEKKGCFIATAAYGSTYAPEIVHLQRFRDEHLRGNPLGSRFVALYERYSPPLANWIAPRPNVRLVVQKLFLAPILSFLRYRA